MKLHATQLSQFLPVLPRSLQMSFLSNSSSKPDHLAATSIQNESLLSNTRALRITPRFVCSSTKRIGHRTIFNRGSTLHRFHVSTVKTTGFHRSLRVLRDGNIKRWLLKILSEQFLCEFVCLLQKEKKRKTRSGERGQRRRLAVIPNGV